MDADGRPRSKSAFSFRSSKSDKSDKVKLKIDLHETGAEKRKSKFNENTKKNPNKAMNEAQPCRSFSTGLRFTESELAHLLADLHAAVAALEKTTLPDIRAIQHRDAFGNIIGTTTLVLQQSHSV